MKKMIIASVVFSLASSLQEASAVSYYEPVIEKPDLNFKCSGKQQYLYLPFLNKYDDAAGFFECATGQEVFSPCDQLQDYYFLLSNAEDESAIHTRSQVAQGLKERCHAERTLYLK